MLRSLSCRVTTVESGRAAVDEAIRAARDGRPYRLALLDWKMPGLDGAEAAALLAPTMPVILVTAYDRELATHKADVGVNAVLHKPISPSTLHDAVLSVLAPSERPARIGTGEVTRQFDAGRRVLLVEDNEINRQVVRELLLHAGLEIVEAYNGYEALEKLATGTFDAVLLDVQMPELDGVETVKMIRAQEPLRKLPVIAMTAHAMLGDRERFLDCGMSDYIAKPIEEAELLGVLSRWIPIGRMGRIGPIGPMGPILDTADGLRRSSGNADLYRRLLVELRRDLESTIARLRAATPRESLDILHTLKGSASTLGARRVAEQAATLETIARDGGSIEPGELESAIEQTTASIDAVLKSGGEPKPPAPHGELLPIAKRMRAHLDANNLAAMECFEELKALAGARWPEPMRRLEASLDRLDFASARQLLDAIVSEARP
jgi:two-component system sensor histidine kinase/response regulator